MINGRILFRHCCLAALLLGSAVQVYADIIWSGELNVLLSSEAMGDTFVLGYDLNKDGTGDIEVIANNGFRFDPVNGSAFITADGSSVSLEGGFPIEAALSSPYEWTHEQMAFISPGFLDASREFLGISFKIDGATHYGWFRLSFDAAPFPPEPDEYPRSDILTIHDIAWESDPETPIVAGAIPEPSSVALLLIGGMGI